MSYSAETKRELRQIAATLIAGCMASEPGQMSADEAAAQAVAIVKAVDALEPPVPASPTIDKMAALACPRLHLTLDQRAILNSALFELGQLTKDLAAYASVRS